MLRRSVAVAVLAVFGVAAFATIAPQPAIVAPPIYAFVEPLQISADEMLVPAPDSYIREEQFQRGDTVPAFLARLGVAEEHIAKLARLYHMRLLRPGHHVSAEVSADGLPLSLGFLSGRETMVLIAPEGDDFRASEERAPFGTRVAMGSGLIRSSLFAASDEAGIPDSVAMQLADIFSGDVDFHRDLRKGDRFTVVYELYHLAGRPVRAGRVLAAEFVNQGRTYRAVHFGTGYYAPDGNNMRKAFLRSPLEFSRVSSGFGMRRHPIARAWRKHSGVDYAAPTGTRVRSTSDGVVEFAGVKGGYGKVVILRHQGRYTTLYAHLSRFARGIRRGARIAQNDTIGFVGQTGWATGPHVHYEFHIAGRARNPLSIAMPAARPVPARELPAFLAHAEPLVAQLDLLTSTELALLQQ